MLLNPLADGAWIKSRIVLPPETHLLLLPELARGERLAVKQIPALGTASVFDRSGPPLPPERRTFPFDALRGLSVFLLGALGRPFEKPSCPLPRTIAQVRRIGHDPSAARCRPLCCDGLKFVPASHDMASPLQGLGRNNAPCLHRCFHVGELARSNRAGGPRGCLGALTVRSAYDPLDRMTTRTNPFGLAVTRDYVGRDT